MTDTQEKNTMSLTATGWSMPAGWYMTGEEMSKLMERTTGFKAKLAEPMNKLYEFLKGPLTTRPLDMSGNPLNPDDWEGILKAVLTMARGYKILYTDLSNLIGRCDKMMLDKIAPGKSWNEVGGAIDHESRLKRLFQWFNDEVSSILLKLVNLGVQGPTKTEDHR